MSTLIYYHLGFCFMRNKWYGMKVSPIYSLFLLIIAIVFIVLFPSYVDLKSNNFPLHLLLLSMVFIMNFYWFINSYFNSRKLKLIPLDKILIWCGINSLALLGLHILFVDTFWIVRNKLHLVNHIGICTHCCNMLFCDNLNKKIHSVCIRKIISLL